MNIAIIGAGNVAWHLTRALSTRHRIVQVFSRSLDNAQALAEAVQCPAATDNIGSIVSDADAYIIMVKDDAIAEVAAQLAHINDSAIWMHTSGSCGCNALSNTATSYGVLYPLQTFSRNATIDTSEIPLFVEANTVDALAASPKLPDAYQATSTLPTATLAGSCTSPPCLPATLPTAYGALPTTSSHSRACRSASSCHCLRLR